MGSLVRRRLQSFLANLGGSVSKAIKKFLPVRECRPATEDVHPAGEVEDEKSRDAIQANGELAGPEGGRFGKRKKFALLLSYSGKGYMGMQKNPGVRTIEEDLLGALCKARAFPPCMEADLVKLRFQRCSRTDKGVSAARQLVSIKINLEDPVMLINAHLPPQIRVMAVRRVTKSFDSHKACQGRMYEYLMPTYAFAPYHLSTPDYRMPDATVEQVDRLLQCYVGTHNFHNFSKGKKYQDKSSRRYILSFKTGERFFAGNLADVNSKPVEFISLKVRGQSFMIHQIRKMIGLVIAVVCGRLKEEEFGLAFLEGKFDTPKAPSLGLLLEDVYFEWYNRRFCSSGERQALEWRDLCPQIEEFKRKHIYRSIIETELKEMAMQQWLYALQVHSFYGTRAWMEQLAGAEVTSDTATSRMERSATKAPLHMTNAEANTETSSGSPDVCNTPRTQAVCSR